jgi:dihydroorotate dehydrogenase
LGFYDVQQEALKALMKAIHNAYEIPLQCPLTPNNKTSTGICKAAVSGRYNGFISHYHLTNRKIDCAGLDLKKLLEEIK